MPVSRDFLLAYAGNVLSKRKAPPRFELGISCLLDRRFNQLSHGAVVPEQVDKQVLKILNCRINKCFYVLFLSGV